MTAKTMRKTIPMPFIKQVTTALLTKKKLNVLPMVAPMIVPTTECGRGVAGGVLWIGAEVMGVEVMVATGLNVLYINLGMKIKARDDAQG